MTNQIPKNWIQTTLGGTATLNYGEGLTEQNRHQGGIPVYGSSGITGYHNEPLVNEPGYIIGRKGTVGAIHYSPQPFFPIDTTYYATRSDIKCDFNFFKYLLKTLKLNQLNSDSAVPGLNRDTAYAQKVLLPSSPEQKQIASILSAFDDKIEVNNKIAKTLEEMAQAVFKEWFVINKDKLQIQKIKDMGRVVTGKTPSTKDLLNFGSDYPFVTIPDMTNTFVLKTERYLSQKSADRMRSFLLPAGSVCVSCIATVGLVSITTEESITNQQINSVIPNQEEVSFFLYQYFKRNKALLEAYGAGGSTTLIINKSQFENLDILVPDSLAMKKYCQLVGPMYNKILAISKENQKLVALRDLLLPKLMSGEIRV